MPNLDHHFVLASRSPKPHPLGQKHIQTRMQMSSYTTTMKHADKALQPKELQLKKFDKLTSTSGRCLALALRTIWDWRRLYFQKHSQPANISQRRWTNIYMSRGHVVSLVKDKSCSIWLQDKLHIHTTSGNKHLQKDWEQPVDVLPVVRQVQRHSATNPRLIGMLGLVDPGPVNEK